MVAQILWEKESQVKDRVAEKPRTPELFPPPSRRKFRVLSGNDPLQLANKTFVFGRIYPRIRNSAERAWAVRLSPRAKTDATFPSSLAPALEQWMMLVRF